MEIEELRNLLDKADYAETTPKEGSLVVFSFPAMIEGSFVEYSKESMKQITDMIEKTYGCKCVTFIGLEKMFHVKPDSGPNLPDSSDDPPVIMGNPIL